MRWNLANAVIGGGRIPPVSWSKIKNKDCVPCLFSLGCAQGTKSGQVWRASAFKVFRKALIIMG